jgi:exonuclease SbcD
MFVRIRSKKTVAYNEDKERVMMKFMHSSDLHIGKRVNEFSMLEDQKYIFNEMIEIAVKQKVDGVIIAGDVYDRTVPSAESVDVFDDFLTAIAKRDIPVFIISGNHDSPERLEFGSRIMGKHQVYISGQFNGEIPKVSLEDEYGKLSIHLMPFLKPAVVNRKLAVETKSFDECVREALKKADVNTSERNILVAHQFVTASGMDPERSDSESKSLGGIDNVDVSAFESFDYVALGHIHGPQQMGRETVRYSGSPLKYSFSECHHKKSVTIIEMKEKGNITFGKIELYPQRDMKEIRSSVSDLKAGTTLKDVSSDCYVHVILTDEEEIIDAIGKVREIYPNVMLLDFDNRRTKESSGLNQLTGEDLKQKSALELFSDFYRNQNNIDMTDSQKACFSKIIDKIEEKSL